MRKGSIFLTLVIGTAFVVLAFFVMAFLLNKNGIGFSTAGKSGRIVTVLAVSVFFALIVILGLFLRKNAVFLFPSIITQLENLSTGKKDLKQPISVAPADEMEIITGIMNSFCDNIARSLKEIEACEQDLLEANEQLESNAQGMYKAIGRISSAVTGTRTLSADKSSVVVHEIAQNIEILNGSITTHSSNVCQVSVAIEDMARTRYL